MFTTNIYCFHCWLTCSHFPFNQFIFWVKKKVKKKQKNNEKMSMLFLQTACFVQERFRYLSYKKRSKYSHLRWWNQIVIFFEKTIETVLIKVNHLNLSPPDVRTRSPAPDHMNLDLYLDFSTTARVNSLHQGSISDKLYKMMTLQWGVMAKRITYLFNSLKCVHYIK